MGVFLVTLLNLLAFNGVNLNFTPNTVENIRFQIYDKNNLTLIKAPQLNLKQPIKIIIHDWCDSPQSPWIAQMLESMNRKQRWHLIAMDYSKMAAGNFRSGQETSDLMASRLANFTCGLIRANRLSFNRVHFIAHGLGALIATRAGVKITTETGKRVARLTALDAALDSPTLKMATDNLSRIAMFVDVIHTNGGEKQTFAPFGHVDFYPNGGRHQPGCDNNTNVTRCNHNRACDYWCASMVNAHVFRAFNYKLWGDYVEGRLEKLTPQPMGIGANPSMPWGPYFLETKGGEPYVLPEGYFKAKVTPSMNK